VDTTDVTVGAHQRHLTDNEVRKAMWCQECHLVPTSIDEATHRDASPAELTWGVLAMTDGAEPSWDRETAKCSDVYCHGSTLAGGVNKKPKWTGKKGTQAYCGSCHGIPPLPPHPARYDCVACHPGTINENGGIDVEGGQHINGETNIAAVCNACHGSMDNNAPPTSTTGGTSTSDLAVGAHQSHVTATSLSAAIDCPACHVTPMETGDSGHIDSSPAEVTFGTLAKTEELTPSWDRDKATCSEVYCHGATLGTGASTTPKWTTVDGTQAACGTSCHALPPSDHSAENTFCPACHVSTTGGMPGEVKIIGPAFHVNGVVDF